MSKWDIAMAICVFVYAIGQIYLVIGKLIGCIEHSWAFVLSPTITAAFAGVVAFVACVYMVDEVSKPDEGDGDND